jgi:membrane protease YdiL (CAAX protease family)
VPDWAAFAGITVAVLSLLLLLARASHHAVSGRTAPEPPEPNGGHAGSARYVRYGPGELGGPEPLSTSLLLVNVAFSQGVFGVILLAGVWLTGVPASALGVTPETTGPLALALGVAFGLALALANTAGGLLARRFGFDPSEELRELLAPRSLLGWVLLLLVVLPVIAGFEELLFRAALVGAFSVGFGVSPWLLAVGSSVAFALGHGAQGPAGVAVTGVLGFVLAAGFVLSGSLLVVVVAHYLVNALEFVVYEGLGVELSWG